MALMHSFAKFNTFVPRLSVRFFSVSAEKEVKKSVFVSQSKDVYINLALQEWIHKNFDFENHHVLMIAQNDPCVVVGRDQNPWLQTNIDQLDYITENGTRLARGTHSGNSSFMDNGNLNLTFFTPSKVHNTRYNLEVIRRALFREYNTKVDINNKDLMKRNFKLSEGGERFCELSTYHQCSLLVDTNKLNMDIALQKPKEILNNFNQRASPTLKVMNLREENSKINVSSLLNSIGWEYLRTTPYELKDGGMDLANKQKGFQLLCPTEKWFPGLDEIKENLMSWEWCFGQTPKFTVSRSIHVPQHLIANSFEPSEDLKINLTVSKGLIDEVFFNIPSALSNFNMSGEIRAMTALKGRRFGLDALKTFEYCLDHMVEDNTEYAKKFAAAI